MNRQQRKRLVRDFVESRRLPALIEVASKDKRVVGALCALLFVQDDRFRWRAVEALGAVAAALALNNMEAVRELLRRLEWLMNDESGGSGWHSPEAMASIVLSVPTLIGDFGVLLGSYLDDEPLRRGAHWAVAAIAKVRPDLFTDKTDELIRSLRSSDPYVRGYAVVALALLDSKSAVARTLSLSNDSGKLSLYERSTGEMRTTTVGDLVKQVVTNAASAESRIDVW